MRRSTITIAQFEREAAEAEATLLEVAELLGVDYFTGTAVLA